MLRIPPKTFASRHLFRIPALDKAGIRPAGCADENFSSFCLAGRSFDHASTKSYPASNANKIAISLLASIERILFRFAQRRYRNYSQNAGWSSLVARQAHNLKAAGSNPAPATNFLSTRGALSRLRYPRPRGGSCFGGRCFQRQFCVRKRLPPRMGGTKFTLRNREETKSSVAQW